VQRGEKGGDIGLHRRRVNPNSVKPGERGRKRGNNPGTYGQDRVFHERKRTRRVGSEGDKKWPDLKL